MSHKKHHRFNTQIISTDDLKNKMDNRSDLLIINVLDHETYIDCHITGSINIEYDQLIENLAGLDKEKEIIVYCASSTCHKGDQAYELLNDLGFVHLYLYADGMKAWVAKKYPTTGMCTLQYLHQ